MEWIERLNQAMDYIEKHITEEIDYQLWSCLHIWLMYRFPNISAADGCLLRRKICRAVQKRSSMWHTNMAMPRQRRLIVHSKAFMESRPHA